MTVCSYSIRQWGAVACWPDLRQCDVLRPRNGFTALDLRRPIAYILFGNMRPEINILFLELPKD